MYFATKNASRDSSSSFSAPRFAPPRMSLKDDIILQFLSPLQTLFEHLRGSATAVSPRPAAGREPRADCCIARSGKLDRARSRLYRGQILQENMRLKALAEIYTMHSFAQLRNLIFFKISPKFRQNFAKFSKP